MIFAFKNRYPHLAPFWDKYAAQQERKVLPAKTILLQEGKIAGNYYFIESGCLRIWFDNNGRDTTFQFFFEHEGLASFDSFIKNIPSIFSIESIEPTTVHVLHRTVFMEMMQEMEQTPELLRALLEISFERQRHYMNEFLTRIRDTPQQRYQNLVNERPHIVKRVPQHYIASYLGITSVHLSRIKRSLAKK